MNTMLVKKGDKVNVNFYNVDDVQIEKHSFTLDDPYAVNLDLAFSQNGNATFTADQEGYLHLLFIPSSSNVRAT